MSINNKYPFHNTITTLFLHYHSPICVKSEQEVHSISIFVPKNFTFEQLSTILQLCQFYYILLCRQAFTLKLLPLF